MEDDEDTPKDEVDTPASDPKMEKMKRETANTQTKVRTPSTTESLNDEDAKCYASRYNDIDAMLDPKTHYATTGIAQGRLGTCARRLTDYEAQRYLNQNPDLQRRWNRLVSTGSLLVTRTASWLVLLLMNSTSLSSVLLLELRVATVQVLHGLVLPIVQTINRKSKLSMK